RCGNEITREESQMEACSSCNRPNRALQFLIIALALVGLVFPLIGMWFLWSVWEVDYGAMPPGRVYKQVFGRSPSPGISDIRAAGHGFCQGHEVWMRFRVTDAALKGLLSKGDAESARPFDPQWLLSWLEKPDARAAHWEEVPGIRRPEYYHLNATGWY